jgi:hypothetical protein
VISIDADGQGGSRPGEGFRQVLADLSPLFTVKLNPKP